jgi:hypothetical protein
VMSGEPGPSGPAASPFTSDWEPTFMLNTDSVWVGSIARHGGDPAPPSACSVDIATAVLEIDRDAAEPIRPDLRGWIRD